ncbi:protein-glutamate O-methyltransferase CheR [Nocardioides KLBMP 9356]|uniref:protein-glutamate O-methyltransferase n=1 Tax=Nocardioides potassii TaxID=2911371 RepID=A0ABS9HE74_9ACTN|nr:protein-glutamate O-methyltransferase CheR [Nocardioides potassii]MCF6378408.1 protein-glutamate O-methyltransferase CheR [Nocardioides potassii]
MSLSSQSFAYVADLVRREAAIVLEPGKEYLVEARLQPLARAHGPAGIDAYVAFLQSPGGYGARAEVVEALTTNETSWFRDREPFDVLVSHVIPDLLARTATRRKITVWSAACSSGQEAYTIAMLMAEHVVPRGWQVEILATDIAPGMVARTREGRYSQLEIGRGLPAPLMVKHFQRVGTQWQVSDQLRSMVRAQVLNLAAPLPLMPVFDLVFLRNVLIYFDQPTKRSVLGRVRKAMSPEGYLFLGGAETTLGIDESWHRTPVGRLTLNRPGPPATAATGAAPAAPAAPPPRTFSGVSPATRQKAI